MRLPEQAKIREFAYRYLKTMDPEAAADGLGEGVALLGKSAVQEEIQRQRDLLSRQMTRADTLRRLYGLVFGKCNDCVRLVMDEDVKLEELDLSLLSEIKRSEKGALEIKLLNRAELLRLLLETTVEESSGAADFLKALAEDCD